MITLIIALVVSKSRADDTLELIGPGATWHVIDGGASYLYDNKISSDGRLLYTPEIGIRKTHIDAETLYNSFTLFRANNSIGSPVYGGLGGTGVQFFHMFQAGFIFGGYIQNDEDYRYMGIVPFSVTGGSNAFVPLVGLEMNFKVDLSKKFFLGINNIITPVITNSNLSLGYKY